MNEVVVKILQDYVTEHDPTRPITRTTCVVIFSTCSSARLIKVAAWCSGLRVGREQRSCSTPGPVSAGMSDSLHASRHATSHLGQLSLPSLRGT